MKKILIILLVLLVSASQVTDSVATSTVAVSCIPYEDYSKIYVGGDRYLCPNSGTYTYTVYNTSGIPITAYHWELPAGFTIISQNNNQITVNTGDWVDLETIEAFVQTSGCSGWQGPWYYETLESGSCL